jgi:hypothetical protein
LAQNKLDSDRVQAKKSRQSAGFQAEKKLISLQEGPQLEELQPERQQQGLWRQPGQFQPAQRVLQEELLLFCCRQLRTAPIRQRIKVHVSFLFLLLD